MLTMERRAETRAPVSLMGAVDLDGDEAPAVVLDLSSGGVRIQMDAPPLEDRDYQLFFTIHGRGCSPRLRVVHWTGAGDQYHWGCRFCDLPDADRDGLRRSVQAASGAAETALRAWADVLPDAQAHLAAQVLVGHTPSGNEITLLGQDCLDMGPDGVDLFVTTVAGLEHA